MFIINLIKFINHKSVFIMKSIYVNENSKRDCSSSKFTQSSYAGSSLWSSQEMIIAAPDGSLYECLNENLTK